MIATKEVKRKSNHNEIERRRRSRINSSMKNLAEVVPASSSNLVTGGNTATHNMCKSILLERAVDYIKELQSQLPAFGSTEASESSLYKEIINLRIVNEELKRQLTQVLSRDQHSPPMCAACDTQLLCLKCSGLLGQCLVAPTYSPTNEKEQEPQTTDVAGMKTLPIVASTDISPTVMMSTSSLGAFLSPTPARIISAHSPTMVHVDESTISFSNGIGSVIDLNCSIPECALSDASNEVEMINRNASIPDTSHS